MRAFALADMVQAHRAVERGNKLGVVAVTP